MKTKLSLLGLALCGMVAFTGCDDDNNYLPVQTITKAFDEKYPNAGKVEWETKNGYEVADFYLNGNDTEAWFNNTGKWIMTKTEIDFGQLPEAIRIDLRANKYKDWKYTEFDKFERFDAATIYVIEAELGEQEMDLYYTEDGILVKEVPDKDNNNNTYQPTIIPDAIKNKLAELYPNASILEYDIEKQGVEVDIFDGNIHKEVFFTLEYEWVYTEWEIYTKDVPAVVMQALRASAYATYTIDDIHIFEKSAGLFYEFELEQGDREIKITFDAAGILI